MEKKATHSFRQLEIAESARRIISVKGVENLTVRQIAKDLGITNGALYRHFKSKNEIISLLIDDIEKTLLDTIDQAAEAPGGHREKLKNILSSHLSYAERRKGISFVIINETLNIKSAGLRKKTFKVVHKYLKRIKQILIEGVRLGEFRQDLDATSASIVFFGLVQSAVTIWALSGFRYALKKRKIDESFDIYEKGVSEVKKRAIKRGGMENGMER
ncbi:MAG: TetR/AcrR family transcriptional regulator [Candidatus Omnitrophica bacterium]|nr:TetR/AcrR family transcriptional regulator [Candidatus Omnitrophota bacterium]MDD5553752.1 TetR/AcrR family transcriptional regulator [Candidatus Omnitrophota bacterium]